MARGKHAVALFEVIHKDKRFAKQSEPPSAALHTPSWWFKRRDVATQAIPKTPTPSKDPILKEISDPKGSDRNNLPADQHIAPVITAKRALTVTPVRTDRVEKKPVTRAGPSLIELGLKKWNELRPRIVQASASGPLLGVVAAMMICGAVVLARSMRRPSHVIASVVSTDDLRHGKAHPEVLDLYTDRSTPEQTAENQPASPQPDRQSQARAATNQSPPAARQINLNYVLVQSYADEKSANAVCEFLNKNGVPCTIERGVKGWRKDFFLVIGLEGFPRASGPDYLAYRKRIESLGSQFSAPHVPKGFMPQALKWDRVG